MKRRGCRYRRCRSACWAPLMSGAVAGADLRGHCASAERPDTADDTDGRDGRASPDHRSRHPLTDISIAV